MSVISIMLIFILAVVLFIISLQVGRPDPVDDDNYWGPKG